MRAAKGLVLGVVVLSVMSVLCLGQSLRVGLSSGTGFVVTSDGYVLTNEHVVRDATQVTVTINAREYPAIIVSTDADDDIALLKIDAAGLQVATLGNSDLVVIGDTVYTIGCPRGICGTATQGRVANMNVGVEGMIMVDLTATHGSSGGPLLNTRGEVVGITTAGLNATSQGDVPSGFTLAVPINRAFPLLSRASSLTAPAAGQGLGELDLPAVMTEVSPAIAYVSVVTTIPLAELMPPEATLAALTGDDWTASHSECPPLWWHPASTLVQAGFVLEDQGAKTGGEFCVGIFDMEMPQATRLGEVQPLLHAAFASQYAAWQHITYNSAQCTCSWGSLSVAYYSVLQPKGSVAGYAVSLTLVAAQVWGYPHTGGNPFQCSGNGSKPCATPQTPPALTYREVQGAIATCAVGDLLLTVSYKGSSLGNPSLGNPAVESVAQSISSLMESCILHISGLLSGS